MTSTTDTLCTQGVGFGMMLTNVVTLSEKSIIHIFFFWRSQLPCYSGASDDGVPSSFPAVVCSLGNSLSAELQWVTLVVAPRAKGAKVDWTG